MRTHLLSIKTTKQATKTYNLLCNIAVRQVEMPCPFYPYVNSLKKGMVLNKLAAPRQKATAVKPQYFTHKLEFGADLKVFF